MAEEPSFDGFPPAGLAFLAGLAADNSKSFFDAHRETYETALLEPARAFGVELGDELRHRVSPGIHADPRVNVSIFRLNRDIRFSKDKRPYKAHLDLWLLEGSGPSRACPGFFLRLAPDRLILGSGMHRFEKGALDTYREAVAADESGRALERAVGEATGRSGAVLGGTAFKRVPAGFDPAHPRAELLKHDGLFVHLESALPDILGSTDFVTWCADRLEPLAPVHRWLTATLAT